MRSHGARDRPAQESLLAVTVVGVVAELVRRGRVMERQRVDRGSCRVLGGQSPQDAMVGDEGWYT